MEPFNYGDQNENMNGQLKCGRWLSKRSAAIDADWRGRGSNQSDDCDN